MCSGGVRRSLGVGSGGLGGLWALLPLAPSPFLPAQLIFQVTPLSGRQWVVVLQISLPVILLDEALKYLSRKHVDGERRPQALPALLASGLPPTPGLLLLPGGPVPASACTRGGVLGSPDGARRGPGGCDPWYLQG